MPVIQITNPRTNKTITIEADQVPSADEQARLFSTLEPPGLVTRGSLGEPSSLEQLTGKVKPWAAGASLGGLATAVLPVPVAAQAVGGAISAGGGAAYTASSLAELAQGAWDPRSRDLLNKWNVINAALGMLPATRYLKRGVPKPGAPIPTPPPFSSTTQTGVLRPPTAELPPKPGPSPSVGWEDYLARRQGEVPRPAPPFAPPTPTGSATNLPPAGLTWSEALRRKVPSSVSAPAAPPTPPLLPKAAPPTPAEQSFATIRQRLATPRKGLPPEFSPEEIEVATRKGMEAGAQLKPPVRLPPAIQAEVNRWGINYTRLKEDMDRLKAATGSRYSVDLSIDELRQAANFYGHGLKTAWTLARTGQYRKGGTLNKAVMDILTKTTEENGQAMTDLLTTLAGTGVGAAAGASMGETPQERITGAIGGGALGLLGGAALGRVGQLPAALRKIRANPLEAATQYTYASLLSDPRSPVKAGLGSLGGAISRAMESTTQALALTAQGRPQEAARAFQESTTILRALLPHEAGAVLKRALSDPQWAQQTIFQNTTGRFPTTGIGRIYSAFDAVGVNALTKAKIPVQEAMRYTLGGTPTSATGSTGLRLLTGDPNLSPGAKFMRLQLAPLPRVGIQQLERGLMERTPGPAQLSWLSPKLRQAVSPGATSEQLIARQLLGAGAAYGGYKASEKNLPAESIPMLMAALGPYNVPAVLGYLSNQALRRGAPPTTALAQLLETTSPISGAFDPTSALGPRLVPGLISSIARGVDPAFSRRAGLTDIYSTEREKGTNPLKSLLLAQTARTRARIPWVRNKLPQTFLPVDVYGRPRRQSFTNQEGGLQEGLKAFGGRTLTPSPYELPLNPAMDRADPRLRALAERGIHLDSPSGAVNIPGMGEPLPNISQPERLRVQAIQGYANEIATDLITSNPYLMRQPTDALDALRRDSEIKRAFDMVREEVYRLVPLASGLEPPR